MPSTSSAVSEDEECKSGLQTPFKKSRHGERYKMQVAFETV